MVRGPAFWPLLAAVVCAAPALLGCRTPAFVPGADGCGATADTLLVICVGQELRAPGGVMRIAFLGVQSDSRCPVDVQCVWAGNAAVELGIAVGTGPTVRYVLNTGLDPRSVTIGTTRLTLLDLRPTRVSTTPIPSDRYVATLQIARVPGSAAIQAPN
jgi:hypothetical protein